MLTSSDKNWAVGLCMFFIISNSTCSLLSKYMPGVDLLCFSRIELLYLFDESNLRLLQLTIFYFILFYIFMCV